MSNIHYFQRYHSKENVHTANAFLLINKLYQYNPQYFYNFLDSLVEDTSMDYQFRLSMTMQVKSENKKGSTIPDAMIVQNGYRLCFETKIGDWFYIEQFKGHIKSFNQLDTKYKIMLSLSNKNECSIAKDIQNLVESFNKENDLFNEERLVYKHLTFENLIDYIENMLSERDYEFKYIIDDYREYCIEQGLIDDKYQLMKIFAAGDTLAINKKLNLYYRKATDNIYTDILGMYKEKSVVCIGKIYKTVKACMPNGELIILDEQQVTQDEKERIKSAILDAEKYGYNLYTIEHNFFFVETFEECNFIKTSKGGLLGGKIFKLEEDYGIKDIKNKTIKEIADELSKKTWV